MRKKIIGLSIPQVKIESNKTLQAYAKYAKVIAFAQPLLDENIDLFGYYERNTGLNHKKFVTGSWHQIFYILQGSISYLCGDKELTGTQNHILVLPAKYSYKRIKTSKTFRYLYFRIKPTPSWEHLNEGEGYIRSYQDLEILYSLMSKVLMRIQQDSLSLRKECLSYSEMILKILKLEITHSIKNNSEEARVNQLASLVRKEPQRKWTIQEMAEILSVSTSTLNRLCHKYYHNSAINLVIKIRMERSIELLIINKDSILEIANTVGYANASVFSNLFLKYTGIRPGTFRNKHR